MKVGDRVCAIHDFYVEPFFDGGWEVKEGMTGFVYALDQGNAEIAVGFGEALDSNKRKGWSR